MILPCPEDFRDYTRFPLTITLVVLNIFIFVLIFSGASSTISSSSVLQRDGLTLTGRLYYQYLQNLSSEALYEKPAWVHEIKSQNIEQMGVLGAYALRDARFLASAETLSYKGDDVQIAHWKTDFVEFRKKYQEQLLYRFGLSSSEKGPFAWLTYQFSHSNWIHLLSNLAFLALIGVAVEGLVGSGALLFIYVLGGIAGGAGFLFSDSHGTVPMVGASASISALLAFYCVAETRIRVRFLYFVSPMPGQYGAIYLPTLLIVPLFLVVDLANLWATPEGLGSGVAYAAHLGGTLIGALAAFAYRWKTPSSSSPAPQI
ncbi:rhomboid family intramembrane serine protease [uncultured Bdellovibrio sp.]|uniref:rhomboid family intramembrane serine protease n=1 Tax=Bdellovibrio sp. HCB-162 TaxID=3394234 RepID=UPI0025FEE838|nr:rhomboid family intramembrane serine protease [uncultured Bdellovibrio sp.]